MTRFNTLLEGYVNDALTEEELKEFLALADANKDLLEKNILQHLQQQAFAGLTHAEQRQQLFAGILEKAAQEKQVRMLPWRRMVAAAVVLLALGMGAYYLYTVRQSQAPDPAQSNTPITANEDMPPGSNKAILTLANGSQVLLDSAATGAIAQQGNVTVMKAANEELVYEPATRSGKASAGETAIVYNTLTTPRGGQYKLTLPDGSKVWLNAASSISYPTAFKGKDRKVIITGEVYFEVVKDKTKPFLVTARNLTVTVLGTHFNVNAYTDEAGISATLLEGSVQVESAIDNRQSVILKPGQQAQIPMSSHSIKSSPIMVQTVDVETVMAWKNGLFNFNNVDIREIMRQAARWYDVEVVYEGAVTAERFKGKISRQANLSELMKILELNDVKFSIHNKTMTIKN